MRKYFTKQYKNEQEYRNLKKAEEINFTTRCNLGWYELPIPIHKGWEIKLTPRQDIKNREDGWLYEILARDYGNSVFVKRKKDFNNLLEFKSPDNIKKLNERFSSHKPGIGSISEKEYNLFIPAAKKLFRKDELSYKPWSGYRYNCIIPKFYWEYTFEKYFKTHIKLVDSCLEQENAEIKYFIEKDHIYRERGVYWHAPKSYRKAANRTQRSKSKQTLYNILNKNEDAVFTDHYKGAAWSYW
jgi:hypothetical protein